MHFSVHISTDSCASFLDHWSSKYSLVDEEKYTRNIGRPLTKESLKELFEWKNGSIISEKKMRSIDDNYPLTFDGDKRDRYLDHKKGGGAIWNIFYLHCLEPETWPIFDQHTYRAMHYMKAGEIIEIDDAHKMKYAVYELEYIPFFAQFKSFEQRTVDRALFAFGKFLKLAKKYI